MQKFEIVIKRITTICSVMVGVAVSIVFLHDLLPPGGSGPSTVLTDYALLISDTAASVVAGVLAGWLVHFCLWDCLALWFGALARRIRRYCRAAHGPGRAGGTERA